MNIRNIKDSDKQSLTKLVSMMIGDSDRDEVANEVVNDFYNNKLFVTIVTENEGKVNGYLSYKSEPFEGGNSVGEIVFLGVDNDSRKQGIGKELVTHIEHFSKEKNIRKLYVKTSPQNINAVRFWVKQGYEFEARLKDFNAEDYDAYLMGKKLT